MTTNLRALMFAAAVSGLVAGTTPIYAAAPAAGSSALAAAGVASFSGSLVAHMQRHSCKGKNDCKGQGGCKSSDNGCRGKNSCKGKGGCSTMGPAMLA